MFKVGDKVLVEGVITSATSEAVDVRTSPERSSNWYNVAVIRPWTEKPPAFEVWRGKDKENFEVWVMSDGAVFFEGDAGPTLVVASDYKAEILAEYVRQTAGRP